MIAAPGTYIQNASDRELALWLDRLLAYARELAPQSQSIRGRLQTRNIKELCEQIIKEQGRRAALRVRVRV